MKYTLMVLGLLLFFMTGCNNNLDTPEVQGFNTNPTATNTQTAQRAKDWNASLFGPGPANYGNVGDAEAIDNISEQNTTGKSYRSPNAPHPTEGEDQQRMEQIIQEMPGVTPGMIVIIGGHAWVNVAFEETMNGEQQDGQVQEVERRLYEVLPRYRYQVIVNDYR